MIGELERRIQAFDRELIKRKFWVMGMLNTVSQAKKDFPKCKTWTCFMEGMFNEDGSYKADVWYDILDSKDIGEILDWMIEFMKVWKKWFGI